VLQRSALRRKGREGRATALSRERSPLVDWMPLIRTCSLCGRGAI